MQNLKETNETLGSLAKRQQFLPDQMRTALATYGAEQKIISYTQQTSFGNFPMGWKLVTESETV